MNITKDELLNKLIEREWSMGNGQCPDCGACPWPWSDVWPLNIPRYSTSFDYEPEKAGHKIDCFSANIMLLLGHEPHFANGKNKLIGVSRVRDYGLTLMNPIVSIDEPLDELETEYLKSREEWEHENREYFDQHMKTAVKFLEEKEEK